MATFEQIKTVNETIKTTNIKGKEYAEVNQRIKAFRMIHPEGSITTEILSNENGTCIMKATVCDKDGLVLGTGHAYEKESSSFINKTSYIENCETSAVGRALGMYGIGVDTSVASYEEMANAVKQQTGLAPESESERKSKGEQIKKATKIEKKTFMDMCELLKADLYKILEQVGITTEEQWKNMTAEEHAKCMVILKEIEESQNE